MPEDWSSISADITAAIADIGFDVTVTRSGTGKQTPWDTTPDGGSTLTVRVIDAKPWRMFLSASNEIKTGRSLLCAPSASLPVQGDRITMRGAVHEALTVRSVAPGGWICSISWS